jgi:hypothetical protein
MLLGIKLKVNTIFGEQETTSKCCVYCKNNKPLSDFPKHSHRSSGYDARCRACIKVRSKEVEKIRLTAPPKTSVCECCGKAPNSGPNADPNKRIRGLVLDHDPITKTFRGWLCDDCNKSIGAFGDTLEGVMKAVDYLKRN